MTWKTCCGWPPNGPHSGDCIRGHYGDSTDMEDFELVPYVGSEYGREQNRKARIAWDYGFAAKQAEQAKDLTEAARLRKLAREVWYGQEVS